MFKVQFTITKNSSGISGAAASLFKTIITSIHDGYTVYVSLPVVITSQTYWEFLTLTTSPNLWKELKYCKQTSAQTSTLDLKLTQMQLIQLGIHVTIIFYYPLI